MKDSEIDILKEMVKSCQGVIRARDIEIQRLKKGESVSVRLPKIGSDYSTPKDKKNIFFKPKSQLEADIDLSMNGKKEFYMTFYSKILSEFKQNLEKNLIVGSSNNHVIKDLRSIISRDSNLNNNLPEVKGFKGISEGHELHEKDILSHYSSKEKLEPLSADIGKSQRTSHREEGTESLFEGSQDLESKVKGKKHHQTNIFDPSAGSNQEVKDVVRVF